MFYTSYPLAGYLITGDSQSDWDATSDSFEDDDLSLLVRIRSRFSRGAALARSTFFSLAGALLRGLSMRPVDPAGIFIMA